MLNLSELLEPGITAEIKKTVEVDDTVGNSSPYLSQYLSTSACAALAVQASMKATENLLPEGYISVGRRIDIEHDVPAMLGTNVAVRATLREIRGNRLIFDITGTDALGIVFRGINERVVVNRLGLDDKAESRARELKELKERL